jgi:hypothetical protein
MADSQNPTFRPSHPMKPESVSATTAIAANRR